MCHLIPRASYFLGHVLKSHSMDNSRICDQYNGDPLRTALYTYLQDRPEALSAVKCASFDAETAQALPSSAFAWEAERRYPMHTREDVIASIAYCTKHAEAVPSFVQERLADAATAYGVTPDLFRLDSAVKIAADVEVPYALPESKRLPLVNAESTKVAAYVLQRDGHQLALDVRAEAATKVAAACHAYGVPVSPELASYAGLSSCQTQLLADRIGARAGATKVAELVASYDTLEKQARKLPAVVQDRALLMKLAARLSELDAIAGLTPLYGKKLHDPMRTVFNGGDDKYASMATSKWQKLMSLPASVWKDVDVPELADTRDEASFRTIYETLPRDIKMVVEKQCGL